MACCYQPERVNRVGHSWSSHKPKDKLFNIDFQIVHRTTGPEEIMIQAVKETEHLPCNLYENKLVIGRQEMLQV